MANTRSNSPGSEQPDRPSRSELQWDVEELATHLAAKLKEELPHQPESEPLLDVGAVARRLNVSKRTVETLIAEGELTPIWVRGQRRFTTDAIDSYIRSNVGQSARGGRT